MEVIQPWIIWKKRSEQGISSNMGEEESDHGFIICVKEFNWLAAEFFLSYQDWAFFLPEVTWHQLLWSRFGKWELTVFWIVKYTFIFMERAVGGQDNRRKWFGQSTILNSFDR